MRSRRARPPPPPRSPRWHGPCQPDRPPDSAQVRGRRLARLIEPVLAVETATHHRPPAAIADRVRAVRIVASRGTFPLLSGNTRYHHALPSVSSDGRRDFGRSRSSSGGGGRSIPAAPTPLPNIRRSRPPCPERGTVSIRIGPYQACHGIDAAHHTTETRTQLSTRAEGTPARGACHRLQVTRTSSMRQRRIATVR